MKTTWMVWAAAVMTAGAMTPLGCSSVEVEAQTVDCQLAEEGDSCADVGDSCGGGDAPCGESFSNTCGDDHVWHVQRAYGGCPPPPQRDECQSSSDRIACEASPGCRWLTPGCDTNIGGVTGCFAADDCAADSCGPGTYCQALSYNPCFEQACDACSAPAAVCLAQDL